MNTAEQKARTRKVIMDHLKSKGYPNMTNEAILAELKPMWVKLGEAGLLNKDWHYGQFVEIAQAQALYSNLKDAMAEDLQRLFRKK